MINQITIAPGDRVVPWINQCSPEWPLRPLKYAAKINARTLGENIASDFEINYIDISGVDSNGRQNPAETMVFGDAPSRARRVVTSGDVIISTVRTYLKAISYIDNDNDNLICSTGFAVITPSPQVHPKFLLYWVRSEWFVNEIVARSVGVSYPAINAIEIGNLPFPTIALEEQRTIVNFLDRETAKIDELITKKQRLIELLQEQRTALITHAITKGINPDTPMKDSGVEWMGEIPAHWEIIKIKNLALDGYRTFIDGDWIEAPSITTEGVRLIQTGNIGIGDYVEQGFRYISEDTFNDFRCTEVMYGDVLICRLAEPVGRACIAPNLTNRMITSVDVCILKPKKSLDNRFIVYFLSSNKYLSWLEAICRGGTRSRVSRSMLGAIEFPLPSHREQQAITDYLDRETSRIDDLVGRIIQAIEKLQEYRSTLITAAVTGKIDVRQQVS